MGWTIQTLIEGEMTVTAFCQSPCHHSKRLNLEFLRAKLGPDAPAMHDDLVGKLRCVKCRGKKVGLTYTPASNDRMVPGSRNRN